jgi:hypothetical protein
MGFCLFKLLFTSREAARLVPYRAEARQYHLEFNSEINVQI